MSLKVWFKMPVVGGESPDDPLRPKYPIVGNATLVYHGQHVFISFKDGDDIQQVAKLQETIRLTPNELRDLDDSLPFPLPSFEPKHKDPPKLIGLGDVVAWLASKIGFKECEGCRKRKNWLNRLVIWRRK